MGDPVNIAAMVSSGLSVAQRIGVAGSVTVSAVTPGVQVPSADQRVGDLPTSFTVTNAVIDDVAADPDAPVTGGALPTRRRTVTLAAADCAFPPAFGMALTFGADARALRVLAVDVIEAIGAGGTSPGLVPLAYVVQVAG